MNVSILVVVLWCATAFEAYGFYNPSTGRWPSRDPIEGVNPYGHTGNAPLGMVDFLGLWGADVHHDKTKWWAIHDLRMANWGGNQIAWDDKETDSVYDPVWHFSDAVWSWHFDRSNGGEDSRHKHTREELERAKAYCTSPVDQWYSAATAMGRGLHADQDWVAHGDFNRRSEAPYAVHAPFRERFDYAHNILTPIAGQGLKTVDDPYFDADGPNGRATFSVMKFARITSVGDRLYWTRFHVGNARITLTEQRTKALLREFMDHVRIHAKPCGECRRRFLGSD